MNKTLYDQISDAIKDRGDWDARQTTWYDLRHTGVKRAVKPYSGAPDIHFPLADTLIDKLKAFYVQLVYSTETIASFVSKKPDQNSSLTAAVANWFDYQLKQNSNFEEELMVGIDQMLSGDGKLPIKMRWDGDRLCFDAIDRRHLIVPTKCQSLDDADWCVHVIPMSVAQYRANDQFKQDDEFVKSITGSGNTRGTNANESHSKELREGVNYSDNDNTILVWEIYFKDRKTKKIVIETVSPILNHDDEPIREQFDLPYNQGVFKSGQTFPFATLRTEIKDKGFYSERGIPQQVFQFEQAINKNCNTIKQWEDYFGQPQFRATKPLANSTNFKSRPGAVIPDGLERLDPPALPQGAMEERGFWRGVAEYRVAMPDLSADQHIGQQAHSAGKQTATWVNAVVGQSGASNDVRARVFRLDCGKVLNMAWSLYLQYGQDQLQYLMQDEMAELTPDAIHDQYIIRPSGSADSWNKGAELQKAMGMFQTLNGNPYVKQSELVKMVLERDRPENVKRFFTDPGIEAKDQAEQQALECLLMDKGWPAQTHPSDDDKTHLMTLGQFVQRRLMLNEPMTPELAQLILQHGQGHEQQLQQKKDPALQQINAQMQPIIDILSQIAQSDQQQQGGNVVPMPPQGGPQQPQQAPQAPPPQPTMQDKADTAVKVGNMLATLIKAGVPVGLSDIDVIFQTLGLPPISQTQPQGITGAPVPPALGAAPLQQPQAGM